MTESGSTTDLQQGSAPEFSVIVNCRNGERYLREALDSVFAQTRGGWEVVFWDNLSTDRSTEIARSYGERVRCFRGGPFRLYSARNRAVEQARGRFIGFLDSDDLWLPRKLELQLPLFEEDPEIALVYSNCEMFDDTGGSRLRYRRSQPEGAIFRHVLAKYHLMLATVIISRNAYDDCGGFDEAMESAGDADLFLRICHRSKVGYVNAVSARYREHSGSVTAGHPEYHLVEADRTIRRFREADPKFDRTYGSEVARFVLERRIAFMIGTWRGGDSISTRRQLRSYFWVMPAMIRLWIASTLPFSVVYWIRQRNPFRFLNRKFTR